MNPRLPARIPSSYRLSACLALVVAGVAPPALAVNRCVVNGQPVFQDLPCATDQPTVKDELQRRARLQQWHRELDQLTAQGFGLVRADSSVAPAEPARPLLPPRDPVGAPDSRHYQRHVAPQLAAEELRRRAEQNNAQAGERLGAIVGEAEQACGAKLPERGHVGMRDERFRLCTLEARFEPKRQVVAIERDGVPLRLYIIGNPPYRRIYAVDGVITDIRQ